MRFLLLLYVSSVADVGCGNVKQIFDDDVDVDVDVDDDVVVEPCRCC